jgi:hypothetical protein
VLIVRGTNGFQCLVGLILSNHVPGDRKKTGSKKGDNSSGTAYHVKRWRLDEVDITNQKAAMDSQKSLWDNAPLRTRGTTPCRADLELQGQQLHPYKNVLGSRPAGDTPSDLLVQNILHLVTYNTFRGLFSNKQLLSRLVKHMVIPFPGRAEEIDIMTRFPERAIMGSFKGNIPLCLAPTSLQLHVPHATWIDLFPFPRMRDNLIVRHEQFDHRELVADVIGDSLPRVVFEANQSHSEFQSSFKMIKSPKHRGTFGDRKGLILWGEPFEPSSWEAAPGFLEKWGWAVVGCPELLQATNKWRALRGEELISPMKLLA